MSCPSRDESAERAKDPPPPSAGARRLLFNALGCALVGIGAIGVVLPLLPTTPFVLLAAARFARGSRRLHDRLLRSRVFGPTIRAWQESHTIPLRAKVMAITLIAVLVGLTIVFVVEPPLLRMALAATACGVIVWLVRVPTRREAPVEPAPAPSSRPSPP